MNGPVLAPSRSQSTPQFLEDSYATAASFRKDGSWTVQTRAGAEPFQV